jgi:replicative superfamily II helicase
MIDFKKKLAQKDFKKVVDPIEIYATLDRESDKGPLCPAQEAILKKWYKSHRDQRDVIVKLHTGQGKTLIGLLMLQSKLNSGGGPAVYLCPNNYLINQTCAQAKQFGISFCTAENDLPAEFLDGESVLVTSVQKMFNGMSKFGTGSQSEEVSTLLMDDAHACIDAIRDAFLIRIPSSETAYREIRGLFSDTLKRQGAGTFADICGGNPNAYLPVPYWSWFDSRDEVVHILSKYTDRKWMKFAWPLVKDMLSECQSFLSGTSLEITPYIAPLQLFGSYGRAKHRIFMSATVTNDSFLVKGLGLSPETIREPLMFEGEKWSGEKMILIPSLIDSDLDRGKMVVTFGKLNEKRRSGCVVLAPSFSGTKDWEAAGAVVATKETIDSLVAELHRGERRKTVVIVNRYDGIDLPDDDCRILIFDQKPFSENLADRYADDCRAASEITAIHTARTIEQGLGRSVRGEKDYCVIIMTGTDLIKRVRTKESRKYLSDQTRTQIEIGLDIANMARDETAGGADALTVLRSLIIQCLRRDEGWKAYYAEQMDAIMPTPAEGTVLDVFVKELDAERKFADGDIEGAVKVIQALIDEHTKDDADRGWYLQEMARYRYRQSKQMSNELQQHAHRKNHLVLKPADGMLVSKLAIISHRRVEAIHGWLRRFENYQELSVALEDILNCLRFGVAADRFEGAFNQLAGVLGFAGERPDKEWGEGPDNLWALRDGEYLLVECKNEVQATRPHINEDEAEQMNRSYAWFRRYYGEAEVTNILIIPTHTIDKDAAFLPEVGVQIMDEVGLTKLTANVRAFFSEFSGLDLDSLTEAKIQELLDTHSLGSDHIARDYTKPLRVKLRKAPGK